MEMEQAFTQLLRTAALRWAFWTSI